MSFLAGRLAGKEGAYFLQESKQAVGRILQNRNPKSNPNPQILETNQILPQSDVLPEVLRHSLPSKILQPQPSDPAHFLSSKWVVPSSNGGCVSGVSADALNPLRAYVSLPQVTFGPKRWQLPELQNSVLASTANELRRDKYTPVNPEKLKAATVGLAQIAKAFAVATVIVFGSATLVLGAAVSKFELRSGDDIKTKGKDLVQPKLETFKEQLIPLKNWAEETSKKWHVERDENIKEKPIIKEFTRILGAKTSS